MMFYCFILLSKLCKLKLKLYWKSSLIYSCAVLSIFALSYVLNIIIYTYKSPVLQWTENDLANSYQITFIWHEEYTTEPLALINAIQQYFSEQKLLIFCTYSGAKNCVRTNGLEVHAIILSNLCANTPLLRWVREHVRYKLLSGPAYREQLLFAISLCTIWSYGGLVITSRTTFERIKLISSFRTDFFSQDFSSMKISKKKNPIVFDLMQNFVTMYPSVDRDEELWPLHYNYEQNALKTVQKNSIPIFKISHKHSNHSYQLFGALSFDSRVEEIKLGNLGDEIQTLVAIQFYPYLTTFLDRESLSNYTYERKITILMNAWLGHPRMHFPNSTNFHPILTSVHISGEWFRKPESTSFLQSHGSIGARDNSTLQILQSLNVSSYLSGCATMLLANPLSARTNEIYAIDVPRELLERLLPPKIYYRVIFMSHFSMDKSFTRSLQAVNLTLKYYSQAHLVITSRLHAAMPCVGLKTPVIFLRTQSLPGGDMNRIDGLQMLWHTFDVSNDTNIINTKNTLSSFDWASPPENPNAQYISYFKGLLAAHILKDAPEFYYVAKMFGSTYETFANSDF